MVSVLTCTRCNFEDSASVMQLNGFSRQVVGILGDEHVREEAGTGASTFDRAGGQWCLVEAIAAGTCHAWTDEAVHDKPAGDILQLFGDIFADALQLAATIPAGLARLQHLLGPWQVVWERPAHRLVLRNRRGLGCRNISAVADLQVLEHQLELLEAFSRRPEPVPQLLVEPRLQLLDHQLVMA